MAASQSERPPLVARFVSLVSGWWMVWGTPKIPGLVNVNKKLLNMAIEIVDLPL